MRKEILLLSRERRGEASAERSEFTVLTWNPLSKRASNCDCADEDNFWERLGSDWKGLPDWIHFSSSGHAGSPSPEFTVAWDDKVGLLPCENMESFRNPSL